MKEAIHLRFEPSTGHQQITIFCDGANCGTLTMKPEEATWFSHVCMKGCASLNLTWNASGNPIEPDPYKINLFAIDHSPRREP